jgi:hypothetical protein
MLVTDPVGIHSEVYNITLANQTLPIACAKGLGLGSAFVTAVSPLTSAASVITVSTFATQPDGNPPWVWQTLWQQTFTNNPVRPIVAFCAGELSSVWTADRDDGTYAVVYNTSAATVPIVQQFKHPFYITDAICDTDD